MPPVHLFSQCFYICVISTKASNVKKLLISAYIHVQQLDVCISMIYQQTFLIIFHMMIIWPRPRPDITPVVYMLCRCCYCYQRGSFTLRVNDNDDDSLYCRQECLTWLLGISTWLLFILSDNVNDFLSDVVTIISYSHKQWVQILTSLQNCNTR